MEGPQDAPQSAQVAWDGWGAPAPGPVLGSSVCELPMGNLSPTAGIATGQMV